MRNIKNKDKASTTLEAIIVMPTILIMLFAVFFAFQILYQHVLLEYAVSYGASRGALMWEYKDYDFINGTAGEKRGVYDTFLLLFDEGRATEREEKIEQGTKQIIDSLSIVGANSISVDAEFKKSITGSQIVVTASQDLKIPFEAIMKYFSNGDMALKATSVGSIFDPDEYIRNIDYGVEIGKSIANKLQESGAIDKVKGKMDLSK